MLLAFRPILHAILILLQNGISITVPPHHERFTYALGIYRHYDIHLDMESHASSGHLSVLHPTPSFLGPEDKRKVFRTPDVDVVYQRDSSYCHGLCSYSAASSHRLEIEITPVSEVLAFWHFWIGYLVGFVTLVVYV